MRSTQSLCLDGYREDIAAYAHDILGKTLTPDQEAACDALPKHKRVLLPSANEVGKSFVESIIALHHYDCFTPGLTIITAPAEKQLTDILFKELRTMAPDKHGWRPRANWLSDAPNHWIKGYTAKNATSFHGRHDAHVLVLFDEAEGIEKEFWDAAESMADWFLAAYNPINTSSAAALAERSSAWAIRRMSAFNHPNVIADLEGREHPIPGVGLLDAEKVLRRLQAWATPLQDDVPHNADDVQFGKTWWRLGPVAQARLQGIRPTGATNSIFSDRHWGKLLATVVEPQDSWPLQIGCDVARFGDDFTVIVVRRGKCVLRAEKHNGWGSPQIAQRLKECIRQYKNGREDAQNIPVLIDETGGYGTNLHEFADGYRFIPVNVGWKAQKDSGAESFVDSRTELWCNFAELVEHELVDISRLPPELQNDLHDELILPQYDYDKKQRKIMSPKSVTKTALGRSPDLADAMVLAFAVSPSYFESYSALR